LAFVLEILFSGFRKAEIILQASLVKVMIAAVKLDRSALVLDI
jgi:hypothetical protein